MSAMASPGAGTTGQRRLMTHEEFMSLPDDGVERWLIRGELWEKGLPMSYRNRHHSRVTARLAQLLGVWLDQQPHPRGEVLDGEAGCRLSRDPATTVGIDVVYISAELAADDSEETTLIDGAPTLAVEVLSPNDTVEEITAKVAGYLSAGVPLVWIVHPYDRTVTVYRPGQQPEMFNTTQELSGDPHLPGLRIPVASIFAR